MMDENQQSGPSKEQIDSVIALFSKSEFEKALDLVKNLVKKFPRLE